MTEPTHSILADLNQRRTPCDPAKPMNHEERWRIRRAANKARRVLPSSVGELVCRELDTWDNFGYRLGSQKLIMRVVAEIEELPDPASEGKGAA